MRKLRAKYGGNNAGDEAKHSVVANTPNAKRTTKPKTQKRKATESDENGASPSKKAMKNAEQDEAEV
jgi:hypothetical protein